MAAPVRPSDFEAVVVQPEDSLATAIVKTYVRFPVLLYKLISYIWASDGSITSEFANDLCDLNCEQTET